MEEELILASEGQEAAVAMRLERTARITSRFGLSLSREECLALARERTEALRNAGRIEFGVCALEKLARAFCDSPYLQRENYALELSELQTLFYELKNRTADQVTDETLIRLMARLYNGRAGGSVELLSDLLDKRLRGEREDERDGEERDDGA